MRDYSFFSSNIYLISNNFFSSQYVPCSIILHLTFTSWLVLVAHTTRPVLVYQKCTFLVYEKLRRIVEVIPRPYM